MRPPRSLNGPFLRVLHTKFGDQFGAVVGLVVVRGDLGCAGMQQVRFNNVRLIMVQPTVAVVDLMLMIRLHSPAVMPD
jgi:hypothetical protein